MAARSRQPRLSGLIAASAALSLLLVACVPKDAHVPEFARRPFEPFSRDAAIAIALREWRLFGAPVLPADARDGLVAIDAERKPERIEGLWQRVGEYWWVGIDADEPESAWTGKHDAQGRVFPAARDARFAWSAAFISYVMRIAGAGPRFPYSDAHADYINAAWRGSAILSARPITDDAPAPGDLICYGREADRGIRLADLPRRYFASHCDLVVAAAPGVLDAIGGNVADAVTMKHVPVTADGHLAGPDGVPLDDRFAWFAVIRVRYDR